MTTTSALANARSRYAGESVATASGPKLLVMLYDRLVRDLVQAEEALDRCSVAQANLELQHAQAIVLELRTSLDTAAWSGGPGLDQLYTWLHTELVLANVQKDRRRVAGCRSVVEPLRDAWRQASVSLGAA
jgi:flagellar protein FliS